MAARGGCRHTIAAAAMMTATQIVVQMRPFRRIPLLRDMLTVFPRGRAATASASHEYYLNEWLL